MSQPRIMDFVESRAARNANRPAILMTDGTQLTYGDLSQAITRVSSFLVQHGLGFNKKIAVIMPNGPEMVIAFLAISNVAIHVPLNPALPSKELKKLLKSIGVDAIMVRQNECSQANRDYHEYGLPVILMHPYERGSDSNFNLQSEDLKINVESKCPPRGNDLAVILTTSGTTSTPKIVPLTHRNICWVVEKNIDFFNMSENERCLNVIPQHHIYSIVVPILCSLASGGSVICTESFSPKEFIDILERMSPTWYAASPSIHQAILRHVETTRTTPVHHSLSRIQSGGALLSADLQKQLEQYFGVMVVQGYGLTETTAMGTCNPPLPQKIRIESAGIAVGCEVAILGEDSHPLPSGQVGRIVVKGLGVTPGYMNDNEPREAAFVNDFFITGDLGYLDDDHYLFITGRVKEIINRAGEKISPYEVETELSRHPDVLEAVVYAAPHTRLGEVPVAMVVMKPEAQTEPAHLKSFLRDKIARHKIPSRIIFVNDIPKGSTGKIQRSKLHKDSITMETPQAKEQGLPDKTSSGSEIEDVVKRAWQKVFEQDYICVSDDFFDLGGDSLLFAELVTELESALGKRIHLQSMVNQWTIAQQAALINAPENNSSNFRFLFPIREKGHRPPLFCIHDVYGSAFTFKPLTNHLTTEQPVWAFWLNSEDQKLPWSLDITELAKSYTEELRRVQEHGPYMIVGHSFGGTIALEMARHLQEQKEDVALLVMVDSWVQPPRTWAGTWRKSLRKGRENICKLSGLSCHHVLPYLYQKSKAQLHRTLKRNRIKSYRIRATDNSGQRPAIKDMLGDAYRRYRPGHYNGALIYFKSDIETDNRSATSLKEWLKYADSINVLCSPGPHGQMIMEPHVAVFASKLETVIQSALDKYSGEHTREL